MKKILHTAPDTRHTFMSYFRKNIGYRSTWAEINLDNLAHNFRQIKKRIPVSAKIMASIKADAYGHGLIPVARKLCACGADFFGVASIDEGIRLREAGIDIPILILGLILKEDTGPVVEYSLTATVCEESVASALNKKAKARRRKAGVHVKVDTGMGRIGVLTHEARSLIRTLKRFDSLELRGIFTHFPCADSNASYTDRQIASFTKLIGDLREDGISIPLCHCANSMAALSCRQSHFNMVRPGLAIYGLYPADNLAVKLKPVLALKSRVIFTKRVPAGSGISYGHTYTTKRPATIITIPIGYGDGYPRNLSNKGPVLLHGKRFTIAGRVCMDQIMADVGDEPVKAGDEVVLIGRQGRERITAEELAALSGTISYEIVCGLGTRIPRVYS